jgi:hypothetical protein
MQILTAETQRTQRNMEELGICRVSAHDRESGHKGMKTGGATPDAQASDNGVKPAQAGWGTGRTVNEAAIFKGAVHVGKRHHKGMKIGGEVLNAPLRVPTIAALLSVADAKNYVPTKTMF